MERDQFKTKVVFRKFNDGENDDIIAVFPEEEYGNGNPLDVMSYMHIGQHGACNLSCMRESTIPANPEEYRDLMAELRSVGYNLRISNRL